MSLVDWFSFRCLYRFCLLWVCLSRVLVVVVDLLMLVLWAANIHSLVVIEMVCFGSVIYGVVELALEFLR